MIGRFILRAQGRSLNHPPIRVILFGAALPFAIAIAIAGCTDSDPTVGSGDAFVNVDGPSGAITIRDRTGKVWDVTTAVNDYGFVAAEFQFGLGPDAIPPAFNPRFASDGEEGFPGSNNTRLILGAELDGDVRAYSISALSRHEIVNDVFGETPVAVAY